MALKFFKWLAVADIPTLDSCGTYEENKHASIGMLVLIPALLGFVAMSYAISTLTDKWYIFLSIGFVWSIIILIIDRFMITTFKKSNLLVRDFFSVQFLLRIIFSFGIGIIVSHPLVLFILDSTIQKTLTKEYNNEIQNIAKKYEIERDTTYSKIRKYKIENVDKQAALVNCLLRVVSFEKSGTPDKRQTVIDCDGNKYAITGQPTLGREGKIIYDQMEEAQKILIKRQTEYEDFQEQQLEHLKQFKVGIDSESSLTKKSFSKDYLSRTTALEHIKKGPDGEATKELFYFLMAFFVFLDIIPVISKVSLRKGQYENKISEIAEMNKILFEEALLYQKHIHRIKVERRFQFRKNMILEKPLSTFKSKKELDSFLDSI